ncbi:CD44 antigen isoform X2 [Lathamus discolor]|uniref:CD44 antigen isoform X2 n=1 Tax=Lathamus discolor TaxID=678569 RepID=UPI0032B6FB05
MASFSLWATFGLCLLKLYVTETQFNVSCRYGGVFHVEKNGRYSLTRSEAVELCRALNSTLSTLEQLKKAHELGFETCRYGFVVGYVVIPRINPYHVCAANHTGVYKLSANASDRYDAYCYNETETREKTCEPIEGLDTSVLDTQGEIVIDNADGSRYNADGTRLSGESSTSGADDENVGSGSTHDTTPMDTSIKRSSPSYYGSATSVSHLPDHSSGGGEKGSPKKDSDNEVSSVSPDISLVTTADDFSEKDGGHYPASTTMDSQHETLLEISTQDHWNPAHTDEEEQYPSSTGRVTSENEKHQGPTQHPLLHSAHSGWISQEQNPANTTGSIKQYEITVTVENYIEKESSHTAVASPGGTHHEDRTRSPLPSDNEPGQGTEGITHPTDAPGDEVLHRTTASTNKAGDDAPLTGTITASMGVLKPEDITQEVWAPHITVTAAASPDGAHHEDRTHSPLPSDNEPGQGTEGITHSTDAPGDEVLHRTTASTNKAGDDAPLTGTITQSMDDAKQEKTTKEPLVPGSPPGSDNEQANTTHGSHVSWIPGVFPDIEDHLNELQTPLPTRSTPSIYGNQGPHKGHYESTTFTAETTTAKIAPKPRSAQVPEWLIVVASLVALALILAVCIAVNSRRRCGQKKKLVINNGKGAVEDRKTSGLNGDASKSQEMVHLVHKEQSNDRTGACDEFLTVNETQNHQELDMKSGV